MNTTITRQGKVAEHQASDLHSVEVSMLSLIIKAELAIEGRN